MQIENAFEISAPPDQVYAFLLDVHRVAGCVPGAELTEVVDADTFKGKVKIKVGPITVSYSGTANITERDEAERKAVLSAQGRETTGSGSARATATMTVAPSGAASEVKLVTEFTVAGRVANFGRGVMEDVSRRLVGQMADCIKANLELDEQADSQAPATPAAGATPAQTAPAQTTDAGASDAGASDAGASDAGASDAGASDAGASDAGASDAGASDAGASDAGASPQAAGSDDATGGREPAEARPAPTPRPRPQVTVQAKPVNALGLFFGILGDRLKRLFGGGRS